MTGHRLQTRSCFHHYEFERLLQLIALSLRIDAFLLADSVGECRFKSVPGSPDSIPETRHILRERETVWQGHRRMFHLSFAE